MNTKQVSLSARWTHPEREGILTDRLGHGDISSWSSGTTSAKRPEVGRVERVACPVRRLANVIPFTPKAGKAHNPSEITLMHETKAPDVARDVDKTMEICDAINKRFSNFGKFSFAR